MVMRLPERDQLSVTREKMHSDIAGYGRKNSGGNNFWSR